MKKIDPIGKTFGDLTISSFSHRDPRHHSYWNGKCSKCGGEHAIRSDMLNPKAKCRAYDEKTGKLVAILLANRHLGITHGKSHLAEYTVWRGMMSRCYNQNDSHYAWYGARGIIVEAAWHDFLAFLRDMGYRPRPGLTIERKDNDKNYGPSNCYWGTQYEQVRNRSNNVKATVNGETLILADWADRLGISRSALYTRARKHTPELAVEHYLAKKAASNV